MSSSRRRWIVLGLCLLGAPLVLYALLPSAAALLLRHLLSQQGYQPVTIRLGYPGWHTLDIQQVVLGKQLETSSLTLTVAHGRLDYDLASLLAGRLRRLTLGNVTLLVQGPGRELEPPCQTPATPPEGPELLTWLTAGHALYRLPTLPVQTVVLERGRVRQVCATGPLREVHLSGTVQQGDTALKGALTFQGQESAVYRLELAASSGGEASATLHTEPAAVQPLLALNAHTQPTPAGVRLAGTLAVELTQFAPLLAALPAALALPPLDGTLQAQWQATVPPSVPLGTVWQHPATSVSGEVSCALRLPNTSALGHNVSIALHAEVAGTPAEAKYELAGTLKQAQAVEEARWDVHGTLTTEASQVRGTVGAASSVHWSKARLGDFMLPTGTLHLTDPVTFRLNRASLAWAAGPVALAIQLPSLTWKEAQVRLRQASLNLETVRADALGWRATGTFVASGQYEDITITDLTTRVTLQATGDTLRVPEPMRLSVRTVQAGVEVQDVGLELQPVWEKQGALAWVELRHLHAALLGGYLQSPGLRYTPGERQHRLTVQVEQLDLQRVLQLEQQQRLEGTGQLDGRLPITVTPTGVQVQDGHLEARAPGGVLRYHPSQEVDPSAALSEAQLAFVMQALTNLHYNVLTLGVQYAEDGTLRLTARIEGHNPDWQQGRPIHLNLQVQENIPALLQSLRLLQGEGVQQSISEHLQRRQGQEKAP